MGEFGTVGCVSGSRNSKPLCGSNGSLSQNFGRENLKCFVDVCFSVPNLGGSVVRVFVNLVECGGSRVALVSLVPVFERVAGRRCPALPSVGMSGFFLVSTASLLWEGDAEALPWPFLDFSSHGRSSTGDAFFMQCEIARPTSCHYGAIAKLVA